MLKIPPYKNYHVTLPDSTIHGGAPVKIRRTIPHHEMIYQQTNANPWTFTAVYSPPRIDSALKIPRK